MGTRGTLFSRLKENVCYCLENRFSVNFDRHTTLIYISKKVLEFLSNFGNAVSFGWLRQKKSIKWPRISLTLKSASIGDFPSNIGFKAKTRILQFELKCNGFKGVLFHQFILTLHWFAMPIRGFFINWGEPLFSSLLWLCHFSLVYYDWGSHNLGAVKIIRYTDTLLIV